MARSIIEPLQIIEAAFALLKREKAGAVIMLPDAIFNSHMGQIAALAVKQRLPLISGFREYVEASCLISFGTSFRDNFYRATYYVDRIFKGAEPARPAGRAADQV